MKELTPSQVMAALSLAKNKLIASAAVEVNDNGLSRISIVSTIGADWNEVDKLIASTLGELFTNLKYMGDPAKYTNPSDGIEQELYFINWDGETLIDLKMRLAPRRWAYEDILRREG